MKDRKEYQHKYYLLHKEGTQTRRLTSAKKWRENNRERAKELKRAWDRRAMLNPMHRLSNNLRSNMYHALKAKKGFCKWEDLVGYTLQDLITHLTPLLGETMTWDNYGTVWHVDHIVPKSWFKYESTNDAKFKECWALSNLQPKLRLENIRKGNRFCG